jgi:hypothetical protein
MSNLQRVTPPNRARARDPILEHLDDLPLDVTEDDVRIYRLITSTELTSAQAERIRTPVQVYPKQRSLLAVHWHPEFIPMELIRARIEASFPNREAELVIPTQHNELMSYDGRYTGVEVDCYSASFRRKVQLLFHFSAERLQERAGVFRAMLEHTRKYRQTQLMDLIDSFLDPKHEARLEEAARRSGADEALVEFTRIHVCRIRQLLDQFEATTPSQMIKNKILRNYFDALRDEFDDRLIDHVQIFIKAVKKLVKRGFALDYFYRTEEVMEEGQRLGACVVIPHPEQFWPILLDDLPVDAIEVWNPQSFEYTPFLIDVVNRQNQRAPHRDRPVLLTMGDDCHLGEKVKEPRYQDPAKARREVGLQPPWDDLNVRKQLIVADALRPRVIQEYKDRLG